MSTRTRPLRWLCTAAACTLAAVLVAGCGLFSDDDEQVLPPVQPSPSATATASRSPSPSNTTGGTDTAPPTSPTETPTGIELTNAQQAAFDKALKDFKEWEKVAAELERDPQPNQRTANVIRKYTFDPMSSRFYTSLQRYKKAGVHIEGKTDLVWRIPVVVDLDHRQRPKIVWKQCTAPGSLRVLHGDEAIPQGKKREVTRLTLFAGDDGRWRWTRVKPLKGESC